MLLERGHVELVEERASQGGELQCLGRDGAIRAGQQPRQVEIDAPELRAQAECRRPRDRRPEQFLGLVDVPETSSDDRAYPVEEEDGAVGQDHPALGRPRQRRADAVEREVGIDEVGDLGQRCVPADRAERHRPARRDALGAREHGLAHLVVLPGVGAHELSKQPRRFGVQLGVVVLEELVDGGFGEPVCAAQHATVRERRKEQ